MIGARCRCSSSARPRFDRLGDDVAAAHDDDVPVAGRGPGLVHRRTHAVHEREPQPDLAGQPDVVRRGVGHDEVRRRPGELGAIAHVARPAVGSVDDVEQPATHDHRARPCRRLLEDLGVGLVLVHHPGVQLLGVAEPVLRIGAGTGHVPVQRHCDVSDHLGHRALLFVGCRGAWTPAFDSNHSPGSDARRRRLAPRCRDAPNGSRGHGGRCAT